MTTDTKLAPTDAEIDAIVYEQTGFDGDGTQPMTADEMRRVTRAVLAKWGQPAHSGEPVAWRYKYKFRDIGETGAYEYHSHEFASVANMPVGEPLYTAPQPVAREPLTPREIELMDGMIAVQLDHAMRCDAIANRAMADKQKGWDMERVALLQKFKAAHGIKQGGQHGTE